MNKESRQERCCSWQKDPKSFMDTDTLLDENNLM